MQRIQLIKFWVFFGGNISYKFNHRFLNIIYMSGCFINYKILINEIKKVLPLFLNTSLKNSQFLFVGAKSLYIKDIYIKKYFINNLKNKIVNGIFSNFSFYSIKNFNILNTKLNVNICVFFYSGNKKLILEVKKKNLPIIGLIPIKSNRLLIDYPIIINSLYFHSVFLFSKVLFKLIFLTKI